MTNLSSVSETAIVTLRCRAQNAENENSLLSDDKAIELINNLKNQISDDIKNRIFEKKLSNVLINYTVLRARKYDNTAKQFIKENPDGLIVSLGCGFDTRFWRIGLNISNYIEIDLPELVEYKKKVLKKSLDYTILGISVLDDQWIKKVASIQKEKVLFLAEGLFMYLPEEEVQNLFKKLSKIFSNSQIAFEVVNKKYTQGFYKKMVEAKMKRSTGTQAGSSFQFGLNNANEIEAYSKNIKVVEEWSYLEDKDVKPGILYFLRNFKFFTKTQWAIRALL